MSGKGDKRRPMDPRHCTDQQLAENWARAFGRKKATRSKAKKPTQE